MPCSLQGDPFVFGLAFWPGGTLSQWCAAAAAAVAALAACNPQCCTSRACPACWNPSPGNGAAGACRGWQYNATSGQPGLNPCLGNETTVLPTGDAPNYEDYLVGGRLQLGAAQLAGSAAGCGLRRCGCGRCSRSRHRPTPAAHAGLPAPQTAYGVVFATYRVKVDTLSGVRVTRAEMDAIWRKVSADYAAGATNVQPTITVIAFRGQNRSEAQYIRSNNTQLTEGAGIVEELSLLVSWDRGTFNGFTWYNSGPCDNCGGLGSATCVQSQYDPDYQQYPQSACACERALRGGRRGRGGRAAAYRRTAPLRRRQWAPTATPHPPTPRLCRVV